MAEDGDAARVVVEEEERRTAIEQWLNSTRIDSTTIFAGRADNIESPRGIRTLTSLLNKFKSETTNLIDHIVFWSEIYFVNVSN